MNGMIGMTIIFLLVGGALMALTALRWDTYTDWPVLTGVAGLLLLIFGFLIPTVTYGQRAYGRTECASYGQQTGRPTKFAIYTSFDTGHCLVRITNGEWVSKDQLRGVGVAK